MPLKLFVVAPGGPILLCRHTNRLQWPPSSTLRAGGLCSLGHTRYQLGWEHVRRASNCFTEHRRSDDSQTCGSRRRWYSNIRTAGSDVTSPQHQFRAQRGSTIRSMQLGPGHHSRVQHGSMKRRRLRISRPALILNSIQSSAYEMYLNPRPGKINLSYTSARRAKKFQFRMCKLMPSPPRAMRHSYPEPVSLYTILARYMYHHTDPHRQDPEFAFTRQEEILLHQKGFNSASVEVWATSLVERRSRAAMTFLEHDQEIPPLFVISLLLRRQHIGAFAFRTILRHLDRRTRTEALCWSTLKVLSIRLLRHARKVSPESMTWVASLFATQASLLFDEDRLSRASPRLLFDVTTFSNMILQMLSMPASILPVLAAIKQEKAQVHVLEFMASRSPAITVTRTGFRAISRTQLAHPKTAKEREWAEIKGASWPPWKENRTAMDEDKGYQFGASRALKVIHRMYEAGYRGHLWEELVEVYAGWDTDLSPTIQTRTSLPQVSSSAQDREFLAALVWAGRVRTTRTRRESWACFLAYEMSGALVSEPVYLAMFEKLYHTTLERSRQKETQADLDEVLVPDGCLNEAEDLLLPGDMKEVLADPTSPLHYVYLSEPIPTIKELYHRMHKQNVRPSGRLLAFLLEACPSFQTCINVLETSQGGLTSGIGRLFSGLHNDDDCIPNVPEYLLAALIKCLCRFGHFVRPPGDAPLFLPPDRHAYLIRHDRQYLMEYAYALLCRYLPRSQTAWIAYMDKVACSIRGSTDYNDSEFTTRSRGSVQYNIVCRLVDLMEETDIDVGFEAFQIVCTTTIYAAQGALQKGEPTEDARHILATGPIRLRRIFYNLVGANMMPLSANVSSPRTNSNSIAGHIPGPAELHVFVRALGTLRDYEGLYSFSVWLTNHHSDVDARSKAQYSGRKLLFRTLVALRAAMTGRLQGGTREGNRAPDELVQLVKDQIESVEEWGGWPSQEYVDLYVKGGLKSDMPHVGGR
ncbi:hypothetical protein BDU57DRAFT_544176 [Ampelomyces quisqualis]|uniref:Uncharacterized protein n=1 Tax=Ampelomyces quisqualis TaxID=50730 RepID=A0A6A5R058_AMPQU|nr:hypothetical protein BDU57DRAFT_544176 [Ampelomyces quisqualis]